jgi:hypothetical protein
VFAVDETSSPLNSLLKRMGLARWQQRAGPSVFCKEADMLRKLTRPMALGIMMLAIGTLAACDDDHRHPRWDRGGYGHDRDHRDDHDHGGYHDDNHWGPH